MDTVFINLTYLLASALFIFGIKRLGKVRTAKSGNRLAALAMLLVVIGLLLAQCLLEAAQETVDRVGGRTIRSAQGWGKDW